MTRAPRLYEAQHVHLVGIGGIGLSGIARILHARGIEVTGSDAASSAITEALEQEGIHVSIGHRAENIGQAEIILVTSAVSGRNAEVEAARAQGRRIVKRPQILGELTEGYRTVAVAGTHGKTTTTAMTAAVLTAAGLDPTAIVGGIVPAWNGNARVGRLPGGDAPAYFVIEADEYDRTFLGLRPYASVVTTMDYDHPDIYPSRQDYRAAFREFLSQTASEGLMVLCGDEPQILEAANGARARWVTFGLGAGVDYRGVEVVARANGGSRFAMERTGTRLGEIELTAPGKHNVADALAAAAVGLELGVGFQVAAKALAGYVSAARRFQVIGQVNRVTVVDDYAHHPAEIRATLAAARERFPGRPIWAIFQPHTFSRTSALFEEFQQCFGSADHVIITDIYAAREKDEGRVSSQALVAGMSHPDARWLADADQVVQYCLPRLEPEAVVITLGAGDIHRASEALVRAGG